MSTKITVRRGENELGEYDIDEVARMVGDGRLSRHDEFLRVGAREWQPLSTVLGEEDDHHDRTVLEFGDSASTEILSSVWRGLFIFGLVAIGAVALAGDVPLTGREGFMVIIGMFLATMGFTALFALIHLVMVFLNEERPTENTVNSVLAGTAFFALFTLIYILQLFFLEPDIPY